MMRGTILLSTFPDKTSAEETARKVVEMRFAACVNIVGVRSIYHWENKVEEADECLALFKTTKGSVETLKGSIMDGHPYNVPELVEMEMSTVNKSYLKWLNETVSRSAESRKR